ncbi:hypothetical protein [Streptomyces sp. NPDC002785]|uniref:hypothetical protein n=1 Tax=Streptomyces sp. NPDC002785 TaxID=3154543 RepID=UPI0033333F75
MTTQRSAHRGTDPNRPADRRGTRLPGGHGITGHGTTTSAPPGTHPHSALGEPACARRTPYGSMDACPY